MVKHLITGGCSFSNGGEFGGWTGYLSNYLKTLNPEMTCDHTGFLSQGQELIQKKVMLAISEALARGCSNEDILVVVMWSGTYRKAWYIDNPDIVDDIVKGMPNFNGGMCKEFLDLKDQIPGEPAFFETANGSRFEYNPNGGWYFTVNGSECKLDFVKQHYLLDRVLSGVGKVSTSLENIITLQNFCALNKVQLIQQFFMDSVYQDIDDNKNHQIINYLYKQLDFPNIIKDGMFEYMHKPLGVSRADAINLSHTERLRLQGDSKYFYVDGFHPGELGVNHWCEEVLIPFVEPRIKKVKFQLPLLYDVILPNYIMPNAILTELGMVNYLHSLHSTRCERGNSFFEQQLNAENDLYTPMTFIFDRSMGTFPNSVGGGGNLNTGMYDQLADRNVNSLCIGRRAGKKYIYPITISPHIDEFSGLTRKGSKLNGEYFWKHMSAQALADVKSRRALIFLDYAQENYIEKSMYERLHYGIEISGIPREQIVLAFNSFNAQELYESWFPIEQRRLEVKNWPYVLANTSYYYNSVPDSRIEPLKFISTRTKIRKNYFVFKIRRPRPHRQALLFKLCTDDLLNKGDWSWLENTTYDDAQMYGLAQQFNFEFNTEKIKKLHEQFPHSLQDEQGTFTSISSWTDNKTVTYENAYFYICTETYTHGEHKSITEKVCKPMVNFLPFLFVSFPGALALLRHLGFKTFSPFIDERYDDEPDEGKRVSMVYNEIKRMCSMSKRELHDWYWQMEDILHHNRKHFLNYYKDDSHAIKLIEYLHDRVK